MPVAPSIMMHSAGGLTVTSAALVSVDQLITQMCAALREAALALVTGPCSLVQGLTPSSSTRHSSSSPLGCGAPSSFRSQMPGIAASSIVPSLLHKPKSLTDCQFASCRTGQPAGCSYCDCHRRAVQPLFHLHLLLAGRPLWPPLPLHRVRTHLHLTAVMPLAICNYNIWLLL